MEATRRFSILPFPQRFTANGTLVLNFVFLPRNQNPLAAAMEGGPLPVPAFADAALSFEAHLVSSLAGFPNNFSPGAVRPAPIAQPTQTRTLFEALASNFDIRNRNQSNADLSANAEQADQPLASEFPVKKYLPFSYRQAFNFTTPRTKAAVIDDSYRCAVRGARNVPGFKRDDNRVSWGKVFAYALRQPLLAHELGMIYSSSVEIDPALFKNGGWLFVDLAAGSDFRKQADDDPDFVKKYAARIPPLKAGEERTLFAPILFPVLYKANPGDADPSPPPGEYDPLMIEAAEYNDGFAKIVHAIQPKSRNLLEEAPDDTKPVKDAGIRLGWDDEQILIWYLRQLTADAAGNRLDAPLGVFGYAVDVREAAVVAKPWETLNEVSSHELSVPNNGDAVSLGEFHGDLPYQVYPMRLNGDPNGDFWLPMYFANWTGHSMVLPDRDAAEIYQTTGDVKADPERPIPVAQQDKNDAEYPNAKTGTGAVEGGAPNNLNTIYKPVGITVRLRYGHEYEFRVRLRDLSGGGAKHNEHPAIESPSGKTSCHFKRYVCPNRPRIADLPLNSDGASDPESLSIQRPLLGYPAVVYTGKYGEDAVPRLKAASKAMTELEPKSQREAFGIFDPDVDQVEITVEIETLKMDNLQSVSGKENYIHLYTTTRRFGPVASEDDYGAVLNIPIVYRDVSVLHTSEDERNLQVDFGFAGDINELDEIYLPTARRVRLTLRAICEDKGSADANNDYYGVFSDPPKRELDSRYGHPVEVRLYRASADERDLFVDTAAADRVQGIFLQPDEPFVADGKFTTLLFGKEVPRPPDIVQRLAKQLQLESIGLTLVPKKGERAQFGCSSRIRHTLAPDNSSLTFSSKTDLPNHWLCCVQLIIDRDWMWDALDGLSFVINRTVHFTHDEADEVDEQTVGEIEVKRTASLESLHGPQRDYTRVIFVDAVEPKNPRPRKDGTKDPRFPDTIRVTYTITTRFKDGHAAQHDDPEQLAITLPITTPPAQVPKIASAGIALSPYKRNEKYSATEPRRRFLWIEFAEPVKDPQDTFFARVLAYAPDQLISDSRPELLVAREEPPLPIDPEPIRVVIDGATNDLAGLTAMQPMEKATDSDVHYLLPLPAGLHANADEMFGFFTYEFRLGHYMDLREELEEKRMVWTTAQGRFGRPLSATGIQHPAPALTCTVQRDENKLWVSAPYAVAVFDGRNVTADPPRTQLWCLLYAQARQADNLDWRNILLDDKQLDWRVEVEDKPYRNRFLEYDDAQRRILKNITIRNFKDELNYAKFGGIYKLADQTKSNKDAAKRGTAAWSNSEISQSLALLGLPNDSPLSVLVVEFLPVITNIFDAVSRLDKQGVNENLRGVPSHPEVPTTRLAAERLRRIQTQRDLETPSPASDELGQRRILRTSPLTEVPFVCCPKE
jgi:hypothetical protein